MINYSDFFIAIYTNQCKNYCDQQFFKNLFQSDIGDAGVHIVDNSIDEEYVKSLQNLISPLSQNCSIDHIIVSREDKQTLFLRNVTESVNFLRDMFLKTSCKYFVILESDVLPPQNWLHSFNEVIEKADIIGGIYYKGFHSTEMFSLPDEFQFTHHVLSGCALYKREVIERIPFRWSLENRGAFPDAWICYDSSRNGNNFKLANYSKIKCKHLDKPGSMVRGQEDLI
jgi:hypothetical protein